MSNHTSALRSFFQVFSIIYFHPKHKDTKNFENHVGIHWIAIAEYSYVRVAVIFPGFLPSFCLGEIIHLQYKKG